MEAAQFTIPDAIDGPFDGFTRGDDWNGWECPFFTREVAETIMAVWQRGNPHDRAEYDAGRDAFIFASDDDGEDGPQVYEGVDTEEGRLYSIGGWNWTWERVE